MVDTAHFRRAEFICKCGCKTEKMDQGIVNDCETLRVAARVAVRVESGYRCVKHNKEVGGALLSPHLDGKGTDLSSELPVAELFLIAEKVISDDRIGIDLAGNIIHIDNEPNKDPYTLRRWYYLPKKTGEKRKVRGITPEWRKENGLEGTAHKKKKNLAGYVDPFAR